MTSIGAWVGRLGELDLLGTWDRQVEQDGELQHPAEGDEREVLGRGRHGALARVATSAQLASGELAPERLERPQIDVGDACGLVGPFDEGQEVAQVDGVLGERLGAAALVELIL